MIEIKKIQGLSMPLNHKLIFLFMLLHIISCRDMDKIESKKSTIDKVPPIHTCEEGFNLVDGVCMMESNLDTSMGNTEEAIESSSDSLECENWEEIHPNWLWCDDFEINNLDSNYFDVYHMNGDFSVSKKEAFRGDGSLETIYRPGRVENGSLKRSFGKNPVKEQSFESEKFQEIYWRFYVKTEKGFQGSPNKLTRATMFTNSGWGQGMIAHLWEGGRLDPVTLINENNQANAMGINDWSQMSWIGAIDPLPGQGLYSASRIGEWTCVEVHVKLNTPGESDGVHEYWFNDEYQVGAHNKNFRRSYVDYGINTIFLESYWNTESPVVQSRFMDNFVISTERIGCL